jgi:MFS family permease
VTDAFALGFDATPTMLKASAAWDRRYEVRVVSLLAIGFGLVGLDRFIISPLFPAIQSDLHLGYQDLGLISASLALCWGFASVMTGRLADRFGRKTVLVPATIAFSLFVALSGLAGGLISLLAIRGLMGLCEGAYVPASIVATTEASKPTRIGLNVGLQQMAAPFLGLALGPLIAVYALKLISWRWIFVLLAIPGLLLALALARTLKNAEAPTTLRQATRSSSLAVLRYRNVVFNTLGMLCWLSCLIVLTAFTPNYLTDYLHLSLESMGLVTTGLGIGSVVGMIVLPALSDRVGRKRVVLGALCIELLALWVLLHTGPEPAKLFVLFFIITFMNAGVVAITVGPLTTDSVPVALAATATGVVVGVGEIFGGALAPALAGLIAQRAGIRYVLVIAFSAIVAGLVVAAIGVREPDEVAT